MTPKKLSPERLAEIVPAITMFLDNCADDETNADWEDLLAHIEALEAELKIIELCAGHNEELDELKRIIGDQPNDEERGLMRLVEYANLSLASALQKLSTCQSQLAIAKRDLANFQALAPHVDATRWAALQKELAESKAELEELNGKLAGRPATGLQCGMNYEDACHSTRKAYYAVSRELAESKAECERLRAEVERLRDRIDAGQRQL